MFELPVLRADYPVIGSNRSHRPISPSSPPNIPTGRSCWPRSAGGLIALEMAARLAEQGRPVKHLVLIDPPIRKNGTLGFGASPLQPDLAHRTKRLFQRLLPRPLRLRYYDLKWNKGIRSKNSALGLSTAAQAKLYVALSEFYPPRHSGPVTILTSPRRMPRLQGGSHADQTLPDRHCPSRLRTTQ